MKNLVPKAVKVRPIESPVPKSFRERLWPMAAVLDFSLSERKVPDLSSKFSMVSKSLVVPTMEPESIVWV